MLPRRSVSLLREIRLVQETIIGLRQLAEYWKYLPSESPEARSIPASLSASLAILDARLLMFDRVISGTLDPLLFWCPANDAGSPLTEEDEPDLHFQAWSDDEAVKKAREELRRAEARIHREKKSDP